MPTQLETLTAQLAAIDSALAVNAAAQGVVHDSIGTVREQIAALTGQIDELIVKAESLDAAATQMLAQRDQVAAAIAALPKPLPFTADYGFVPAGPDPAATLRGLLGKSDNMFKHATLLLPAGNSGDGKPLEWTDNAGAPFANGVVRGLGEKVSTYVGNVRTNSPGSANNGDGNEGFYNGLTDLTLNGSLSHMGNNVAFVERVTINGDLDLHRNYFGPGWVYRTTVNGRTYTGSYSCPPVLSRCTFNGAVDNVKNGLVLDRCAGGATVTNRESPGIVTIIDSPTLKLSNLAGHFYRREGTTETTSKDLSPGVTSLMLPASDPAEFVFDGSMKRVTSFPAAQAIIDAAPVGSTVKLYFPRNTYSITTTLKHHGRRVFIFGCGSRFKGAGGTAPIWHSEGPGLLHLEDCSQLGGDGGTQPWAYATGGGEMVMWDVRTACKVAFKGDHAKLWIRDVYTRNPNCNWYFGPGLVCDAVQMNTEKQGDATPKIYMDGATLRTVCPKFEGSGCAIDVRNGSKLEVLGGVSYCNGADGTSTTFKNDATSKVTVCGHYWGGDDWAQFPARVTSWFALSACPKGPGTRAFCTRWTTPN